LVRVKICGITNIEDALAATHAGADSLGFVFAESPRKIEPEAAREIVSRLPAHIVAIGVFAGQDADEVLRIMEAVGLRFAQIHGDADEALAGLCSEASWGLIRALSIRSIEDIRRAAEDPLVAACDAVLLDAHVEGKMGGTGQAFDWDLAVEAETLGKPIILAGGLTPENVEEAARKVMPYAVDVSTGVEKSPGKKDHAKIKEFIENVRKAE
jgi:phosphoribosylanthranilate isomerase